MFRLGVIEESLYNREPLKELAPCFVSQRIEQVPGDECPVWHTNEYIVPEDQIVGVLDLLKNHIKPTWYIHAFNDRKLYVVLIRKCFEIALLRDASWDEMIEYGVKEAGVERQYLENIPLHV